MWKRCSEDGKLVEGWKVDLEGGMPVEGELKDGGLGIGAGNLHSIYIEERRRADAHETAH